MPDTYLGNDPAKIIAFGEGCAHGAIAKSLTWFAGSDGRFGFTQMVSSKFLAQSRPAVAYSPLLYQEYVPKKFELRVTCVGSTLFAVRILSQQHLAAAIDWRRAQFDIRYEMTSLSSQLEDQLHAIRMSLGLEFGAFDLIITPEEQCVFLEVNASGNWMWLENELGLPISLEVAKWLTKR